MSEGKLSMNISYEFDGKILKEFYDTEEWKEMKQYPYVTWEEEKEKIFSLVKGKKTPLSFQFVMMLKPDLSPEFLAKYNLAVREDEIAGLFINILYDRQGLKCTSDFGRSVGSGSERKIFNKVPVKFFTNFGNLKETLFACFFLRRYMLE